MGFIVLLLFVALLLLLALMALIFTAAASVMGHEKPLHQEEPTCGGCGYIVKNMNEPVCAICHAEFHHVGIVMPPPPADSSAAAAWLAFRRVSGLALGIWTVVAGFLTLGLTVWSGEHLLPFYSQSVTHLELRPKTTGYDSVLITVDHRRSARGRVQQDDPTSVSKNVVVDLRTDKGTRTLKADMLAPSLTYINDSGKTINTVAVPSKDVLVDFMKAAGVQITPQVSFEAQSIARIIADPNSVDANSPDFVPGDLPVDILNVNTDGGAWQASMPLPLFVIPSAAFLWLLGVGVISFLQRGRRAALREQILAASTQQQIFFWEPPANPTDVVAADADRTANAVAAAAVTAANAAAAAAASTPAATAPATKEAGPAVTTGSSVPPAKTDPAKAA